MAVLSIIGSQWGDEGKGKIIDYLSRNSDYVVRFHGGNNAGHTVINEYGKFGLHLIPSGIFHKKTTGIIANGTVLDLEVLLDEIKQLEKKGITLKNRFFISPRCHIIMPYHKLLDSLYENAKGNQKTGTTGRGIAAYKSIELIKLLKKEGLNVIVIMTRSATHMVDPLEIKKVSGNTVYKELFEKDFDYKEILKKRKVDHINIADSAHIFLVAPATANTIAKIAHGMSDDFLTTTLLATMAPIIICPSMNVHMWENKVTQENILALKKRGIIIIDPEKGMLACGYEGQGRLAHLEKITKEVVRQLQKNESLRGKKIMITAGGTIEKIDDVRSITNRSSGKMGVSIAEECYLRGAEVLLIRAKNSVSSRYNIQEKIFETTDDLLTIVQNHGKDYEYIFHTAAVSDFTVEKQTGKISSNNSISLKLTPQKKVVDTIKKINPSINLIAFKAEWGLPEKNLITVSKEKLGKVADVIIANDVSQQDRGFDSEMNEVLVILPDGSYKKIMLDLKRNIAQSIMNLLIETKFF